jgi:ssDNA-binding Zn-finger/Zn-ribbon topoisomerase 1
MYSKNEREHGAASRLQDRCGMYWDRSSPATCPHHRSDYFLSEASETKEKNKSVQFKCTAINEREHGAASRLRDGEGSCGVYWDRSSPATCPHHRSDYFLPEASETKEKNKSVQFKCTARMNADMARLLGFETERDHAVSIGAVPHLPRHRLTYLAIDMILSNLGGKVRWQKDSRRSERSLDS